MQKLTKKQEAILRGAGKPCTCGKYNPMILDYEKTYVNGWKTGDFITTELLVYQCGSCGGFFGVLPSADIMKDKFVALLYNLT